MSNRNSATTALLRPIVDLWKVHFNSPLPTPAFFACWKDSDLEDIDFAFGTAVKKLGATADTVRAAKCVSSILRYLQDFKVCLQEIAPKARHQ